MTLKVNTLQSTSGDIRIQQPNALYAPGQIVQVAFNVAQMRHLAAVPNNDAGQRGDWGSQAEWGGGHLWPLDVTITPKSTKSFIFVEFNIFFEVHHDILFRVVRNGALIGSQWGGGDYSQGRWSGAATARYDNNNDTTPSYLHIPWIDSPGTTDPVTYSLAPRSSNGSNYTFYLNTTINNWQYGSDAREAGVSFSIAQEIAY